MHAYSSLAREGIFCTGIGPPARIILDNEITCLSLCVAGWRANTSRVQEGATIERVLCSMRQTERCSGLPATERPKPPNEKHAGLPGHLPTVPACSLSLEMVLYELPGLLEAGSIGHEGRTREIHGYRQRGMAINS